MTTRSEVAAEWKSQLETDVDRFFTFGSHSDRVADLSHLVGAAQKLSPHGSIPDRVAGVMAAALDALFDPQTDGLENRRWRIAFGLDPHGFQAGATERKRLAYDLEPVPGSAFGTWKNGIRGIRLRLATAIVTFLSERRRIMPMHPLHVLDHPETLKSASTAVHNLPAAGVFLDRKQQSESLQREIQSGDERFVLIKGPAGIGKSRLARHAARQLIDLQTDFDFVYELTAKARAWTTLREILDPLGLFLGSTAVAQATDDAEKLRLLRNELDGKRGLLILDNVEAVAPSVVGEALAISERLVVVLTSRELLEPEYAVTLIEVQPLDDADVRELIGKRSGLTGPVSNRLVAATGGSPLAAQWVGGRLRVGIPSASLERRLAQAQGDVFEELFSDNWRDATEDEQRALMVVSRLAASASWELMTRALGVSTSASEDALADLVRRSLLEVTDNVDGGGRVGAHPLVRAYAGRRLDQAEPGERQALLEKLDRTLCDFCLERNELQLGREQYDLIDAEVESVLTRLQDLLQDPEAYPNAYVAVAELADATSVYLWRRGRWSERVALADAIATLHSLNGAHIDAARHLASAGIVRHWQGRPREAARYAERAHRAIEQVDAPGLHRSLVARLDALNAHGHGDSQAALLTMLSVLDAVREADAENLDVRRTIGFFADWPCAGEQGYRSGEVALLQEIGIIYADIRDGESATEWLGRSIDVAREIRDEEGEAIALSHRGRALLDARPADAYGDFEAALNLAVRVGRRSTEGRALLGLAQSAATESATRDYALRAAKVFRQLGMERELRVCDRILGNVK